MSFALFMNTIRHELKLETDPLVHSVVYKKNREKLTLALFAFRQTPYHASVKIIHI